ncbi:hypothetical protein ACMFMG_011794 [Clarireedia jacksonii]
MRILDRSDPPLLDIVRTQNSEPIESPWGDNEAVKLIDNSSRDNDVLSLHSQIIKETATVWPLRIHKLRPVGKDDWTLTDGNIVLLDSSSAVDGSSELAVLYLESFTCHHFSSTELEESGWHEAVQHATDGACHSGLVILVSDQEGSASLSSFIIDVSNKKTLEQTSSPKLPDRISVSAISIDERFVCIARKGSANKNYQWEILIFNRGTSKSKSKYITSLHGPAITGEDVGDNHVQDIFIRKTCIVAVTTRGNLFYWDDKFAVIPDPSSNAISDLLGDKRIVDTVHLGQDLERAVIMDLVDAENVAMILDKKPSLVPAASRQTGYPRYLRIDADCRTVVRGTMTNDGNSFLTPRFEIYPITEEEPWATIEPLSASLAPYLGSFVDVWINQISLTYFDDKGAIQIRFDGKNEIISLDTSSRYLPLNYDCWKLRGEPSISPPLNLWNIIPNEILDMITFEGIIQDFIDPRLPVYTGPRERFRGMVLYGQPLDLEWILKRWMINKRIFYSAKHSLLKVLELYYSSQISTPWDIVPSLTRIFLIYPSSYNMDRETATAWFK